MASTLLLVLVGTLAVFAAPSAAITDADILNFALNLECLEVDACHSPHCLTLRAIRH